MFTAGRMKAHYLLKHNIDALLTARGQKRKELASWCRRSESWLSQIFTSEERNMPLKYLDRIASFFGIATYQLFQPGITPLSAGESPAGRTPGSSCHPPAPLRLPLGTPRPGHP